MHRDWTTLESSEEDSSRHNDSEEEEEVPQTKPAEVKEEPKKTQVSKPQEDSSGNTKAEVSKAPEKKDVKYDFPTDQELVAMLEAKAGPWMLKIVFSFEYGEDALKEMFPKITKVVNRHPGTYEVHFDHLEDAKDFLAEKKAKRYRFRIKNPEKDAIYAQRDQKRSGDYEKRTPQQNRSSANSKPRQPQPEEPKPHVQQKKTTLFKQENKIVFENEFLPDKVSSDEIVKEINQREIFKEFSTVVLVAGEEKDEQLFPQVKKLAEEVSQKLGRQTQEAKSGGYRCIKIMELLSTEKKPETKVQEPSKSEPEDLAYNKRSNQSRAPEGKKQERRSNIIRHNTIMFKRDLIDKERLFKQLRESKLIEEFGYLRIKAFEEDLKGARELALLIEKEFNCDETSTYYETNLASIVLRRKSQQYIEPNDNIIKVANSLIVDDAVNEVKKKWNSISESFKGVGVEYNKESKVKADELIKELKRNGFEEIERRDKGESTRLTFVFGKKEESVPVKPAPEASSKPQQRESNASKAPAKHSQKPNSNELMNLAENNLVQITKKIDEKQLLEEYDRKKEVLFEQYNAFRLRTEVKELFEHTSRLGELISERYDLLMKESESKTETGIRMDVMLRKKKLEKEKTAVTGKKKPDTTKINEYLDS